MQPSAIIEEEIDPYEVNIYVLSDCFWGCLEGICTILKSYSLLAGEQSDTIRILLEPLGKFLKDTEDTEKQRKGGSTPAANKIPNL